MSDHPPEYRRPNGTHTGMPYVVFEVRDSVLRIFHAKHIGEAILVKSEWERGYYKQAPGHKRKLPIRGSAMPPPAASPREPEHSC